MRDVPLHYSALTDVSARIHGGEVSPVEVTRALLTRIEALDPTLHAYVTVTADGAIERATQAEREIRAGAWRGPLHGVPVAVKDLFHTRGVRTTAGTRVLRDFVPEDDARSVELLEAAGAVLLGKTAMTEGAFSAHHPDVVPPVNPWDEALWTGISSSGSGVATAAGLCFASLGTDTGGSIRFPSAANGLVGVKPTYGRVSRRGVVPLCDSLDHVGPMARNVADAAAVLGVIAGHDPADPTSLRSPVPDYLGGLRDFEARGGSLRGLRVAFDPVYASEQVDAPIAAAVETALDTLRDAGAVLVRRAIPPVDEALAAWVRIAAPEIAYAHAGLFPGYEDEYGPELRQVIEGGRALPATAYIEARRQGRSFRAALARFFEDVHMLACPALAVSLPADANLSDPGLAGGAAALRFTGPFDVSGHPTVTLPCAFVGRAPVALQLVGRHLGEATLLRAARAFEMRTPWHDRHPPL